MSNVFSKFRDFIGLNEPLDYEYEFEDPPEPEYRPDTRSSASSQPASPESHPSRPQASRHGLRLESTPSSSLGNVIDMPRSVHGNPEVVILDPRSFEEMPQVIQALRERKSVVLNLNMMEPDQAQRAVDFVAGGTFAIDGHQERVGESIFLFTPKCVQVTTQGVEATQENSPPVVRPATPVPAWAGQTSSMMA